MKKLTQAAAAIAIGAACAMPVMAQDTGSTASSTQMTQTSPDTQTLGAGPEDMNRGDEGRDMGWIGLLGLAGLLGLRRRHHHDDDGMHRRQHMGATH